MYQKSYTEYIKEDPDSEFSKFLIKFFSSKPDLETMGRDVREFDHQLAMEQKEELRKRMLAEAGVAGKSYLSSTKPFTASTCLKAT